jgi:uncharacterized protein YecE (DUF72 family)
MAAVGTVRIGISGWTYAPWRGVFYPAKLPQNHGSAYAASIFRSIEINGTFYPLQRPERFPKWAVATPEGFVFSVKGPRFITHIKRLAGARIPLANFWASGVLRPGPILWQLPPTFYFDAKRPEAFFKLLPRDTEAAAALARKHDKRLNRRSWTKTDARSSLRHCLEIRYKSFAAPEFIELLQANDIGLACADAVQWPRLMDLTSDFVYCRLHGPEEPYASGYDDAALDRWAECAAAWARGKEPKHLKRVAQKRAKKMPRDVYVYFDNDAKVRAPFDAQKLMKRMEKLLR